MFFQERQHRVTVNVVYGGIVTCNGGTHQIQYGMDFDMI